MASKKRKRSALSPQPYHRILKQATGEGMLQRSESKLWSQSKLLNLFSAIQSNLESVQIVKYRGFTAFGGKGEEVLREKLAKLENDVDHLDLEPGMTEDDRISFWSFACSHWPYPDIPPSHLQDMFYFIIHHRKVGVEKVSKTLEPRPFLETGLGGLAPELREMILINLVAIPPPYGGRDIRVEQKPMLTRSPISLTAFVDLKASCLAVLQTCRQIYLEAFPIFYASKSYYLASSQDLANFLKFGSFLRVGPQLFRFDTITSLCLKDLIINIPKWSPQQIDHLTSQLHSRNREELEAERMNRLDFKLVLADLRQLKNLRKICLCIRVGEEWEYLRFLFSIRGLGRGVIDFLDNFHWTIRSQSVLEGDWKLHYTAFTTSFFMRGKNFERLSYQDVNIQGEVLNIDSRASDLVEGDERWVEVDIGSRNYEERLPILQRTPDVVPAQAQANQQGVPSIESVEPSTDDESEAEDLQAQIDWEEDDSETGNNLTLESNDSQGQTDGEEDDTQPDNDQDQESEGLQRQPDEGNEGAKVYDAPDQESRYPQDLADGDDHNTQAEPDVNQESVASQRPPSENYTCASTETVPEEVSEDHEAPLNTEVQNAPTATESSQQLEGSIKLVDERNIFVQAGTNPAQTLAIVPIVENKDDLEAVSREKSQTTTDISSRLECEVYHDAQTQIEPIESKYRNFETQTETGDFSKDLQMKKQTAPAPSQNASTLDQRTDYPPKVRDGQQLSAQPNTKSSTEPQDSARFQQENNMATKSLYQAKSSLIPHNSPQNPSSSPIPKKIKTPLATMDNAGPKAKRQSLPVSNTKPHIHGCIRAAALMFALSLFYVVLDAKLENTLGQLLALLLFVLLFFIALWSEDA